MRTIHQMYAVPHLKIHQVSFKYCNITVLADINVFVFSMHKMDKQGEKKYEVFNFIKIMTFVGHI